VKAFVPVRIRLVTQFRWAEVDRLPSTIRRAYRPWRKPWRSGFDSRHGVPPFDHATCPSVLAETRRVLSSAQTRVRKLRNSLARFVGYSRSSTAIERPESLWETWVRFPSGASLSTGR